MKKKIYTVFNQKEKLQAVLTDLIFKSIITLSLQMSFHAFCSFTGKHMPYTKILFSIYFCIHVQQVNFLLLLPFEVKEENYINEIGSTGWCLLPKHQGLHLGPLASTCKS